MVKKKLTALSHNDLKISLLNLLFHLGALFIFLSITYFITINWYVLTNTAKMVVSLGSVTLAYLLGLFLQFHKKYHIASSAFFLLTNLVLPIGLLAIVNINILPIHFILPIWVCVICLLFNSINQFYLPKLIFVIFIIVYASLFFLSLIQVINNYFLVQIKNIDQYECILLGISYLFLGYLLRFSKRFPLTNLLYGLGSFLILFNTYVLDIHFLNLPYAWEIVNLIALLLNFILAIVLKNNSFLYSATLFLIFYLLQIGNRFIHLLGPFTWPLLLAFVGFALMMVGFLFLWISHQSSKIK